MIELVPMAYRITADLALREEEWTGTSTTKANRLSSHSNDASSTAAGAGAGTIGAGGTATVDEEESREAVFHRLESLGYRVGLGIVERYVYPSREYGSTLHTTDITHTDARAATDNWKDSPATPPAPPHPSTA